MSKVDLMLAIVKIEKYINYAVQESLKKIEYAPQKDKVFIKPNVAVPARADSGIVTNPKVVGGIIDYLRKLGIDDITIGEGTFALSSGFFNESMRTSGYFKLAEKKDVKIIDLDKCARRKVKWKYGRLSLPKIVFEAEYINVPVMKTHYLTLITASLKNQKGLLSVDGKKLFHFLGLSDPIAELGMVVKPNLIVVDASIAMEGNGPIHGKRKRAGLIISGYDMVGIDWTCCKLMGISPQKVRHLVLAEQIGVGKADKKIVGRSLEDVAMKFEPPAMRQCQKINSNIFVHISDNACSRCIHVIRDVCKEEKIKIYKRLDLLVGTWAEIPKDCGIVACVGNCAKAIAKRADYPRVFGCPPEKDKFIKFISHMLKI
jgi:uncharacterized protein (DUF362 family)